QPVKEEEIRPCNGDVFLGLGLNQKGICANANLLAEWADKGLTVIFYVYDLLPIQYPQFWPLEAKVDVLHHEWLSTVISFDEVICISETTAKRCREFLEGKYPPRFPYRSQLKKPPRRRCGQKAEISSILLGCDFASKTSKKGLPANAEELLVALKQTPTFLMVGTLEPRKGHRQVLAAFERLWEEGHAIQLVIVGHHGWMMEDFLEKIKNHVEKDKKLFWIHGSSDEYLEKIYNASACLLAASFDEGFGLPLIEAACRGKSIIARNLEVFHEVVGDKHIFFEGGETEIAKTIKKWIRSKKKKTKLKNIPLKKWQAHIDSLSKKIKLLPSLEPATKAQEDFIAKDLEKNPSGLTRSARDIYGKLAQAVERMK
ncbi:MAG: glycosyltransferase family 1 protein, partial [Chlamydiae bacterium]|nr:glycosyltransferase family 1 protein [Chlamydiota bacterium]